MNKDQVKGRYKQAKGSVKESTGKFFGDKTLEIKGKAQNTAGKVQAGYGDAKEDIEEELEDKA